jgi:short-subunit dehydrogenase
MCINASFRKQGLILNIGSMAGAVPSPMLATYSGTKAFLSTFSSALGEEVKKHNIVVEHVNTYFVVRIRYHRRSFMITLRLGVQAFEDPQIFFDDS